MEPPSVESLRAEGGVTKMYALDEMNGLALNAKVICDYLFLRNAKTDGN